MGMLIRGGKIVTASDTYQADIRIRGEVVAEIGQQLAAAGDQVIDAAGRWVIPGGIDPHVHCELPFMGAVSRDDFDSGTVCALAGGTTTILDFAIPPKGQTLKSAIANWDAKAKGKARCDYGYHIAMTDWNPEIAAEMPSVINDHGITSFKVFTAYLGVYGIDDYQIFKALREVSRLGGLITVHAVNGQVLVAMAEQFVAEGKTDPLYHGLSQPPEAEGEATGRVIRMAEINRAPIYIVHTSAADAVDEIAAARRRGKTTVLGETCTQYLMLSQDLYELPNFEGAKYVLSPPLKPREHCEALWRALADHTIETVGTDHCSFDFNGQKNLKGRTAAGVEFDATKDFRFIPNGLNGLEERLTVLYTYGVCEGRISAERWVALSATNAAKIFGLYPRKGTVAVGSDADLVLWDPDASGVISAKTHKSRCDYNVYEGFKIKGRASVTIQRGRIVYEQGEVTAQPGAGQYLKREKFNPRAL